MAHFIISYDLRKQRNYQPLWDTLASWGAVRLLESLWVVTMNATAAAVRDSLRTVIDSDDGVAVMEFRAGSGWGTVGARDAGNQWFKSHSP